LTVYIDPGFTDAQKAEIRTAIQRWNAEGADPRLVETNTGANINIKRNDNLGGGAVTRYSTNSNGAVTHVEIEIDTDGEPGFENCSVAELTTHELGHALGLDHTDNPDDAMIPEGSNGHDGALSKEDSLELKRAISQANSYLHPDGADGPSDAFPPGIPALIDFDLGTYFPPEVLAATVFEVFPFYDPMLYIENVVITPPILHVGVFTDIMHPNSTLYMLINMIPPPPYEPVAILGTHYIHNNPVPHVAFECPFEISEENGNVYVKWVDLCTYPFENNLRSRLVVDEFTTYMNKGGGDYVIQLEPGSHLFELYVNDFQVNNAYSSQAYFVTGISDPEPEIHFMEITPNPFTDQCNIRCTDEAFVKVFDQYGRQVDQLYGMNINWKPAGHLPSGIYFVRAYRENKMDDQKVVYLK